MLKSKAKTKIQIDIDRLVAMGQSINTMIEINASTASYHYLIAKLACHRIVSDDDDFRELLTLDDIQRLATLNESLHRCQLQSIGDLLEA